MQGSCLCGAIEYEIDSIDMPVAHCHCRTCQKAHAAPFATTAGVTVQAYVLVIGGLAFVLGMVLTIWLFRPLLVIELWARDGVSAAG